MKNFWIATGMSASLLLVLGGCEKDEKRVFFEEGTAPVLSMSNTAPALTPGKESDPATTFSWTNPNYQFTTGPSSQSVNYTLEIDTVGANFGSKSKGTVGISSDLNRAYTVGDLNILLSGAQFMGLTPDRFYDFEARVTSSVGSAASLPLRSNVVRWRARPFSPPPAVEPPTAGTLWGVGDAFASGWSNPLPAPFDNSQKFNRVSNTLYELVVDMPGGGGYKLIQTQGVWGTQYRMVAGGTWEGGTFLKEDADPPFPGPPSSGKYKITVNFQSGRFTSVKQP
jgi:hypothetical protein